MSKKSVEKLFAAGCTFLRERDIPVKCGRTNYALRPESRKPGEGECLSGVRGGVAGAIRPATWGKEEKAERRRQENLECARVNNYSSDKNLIF